MVTDNGVGAGATVQPKPEREDDDAAYGWYLYGITRHGAVPAVLGSGVSASGDDAPLQLLEAAGLVAIVRKVRLADFTPAALQERLRSASELEALVRRHNDVIEAIHEQQVILPARFGMVYPDAHELLAALRSARDTLPRQLDRLEGCDEWAVHLYVDDRLLRERLAADPHIRGLREQLDGAGPGRAFFLERRIEEELEAAAQQELARLSDVAFARLAEHAVDAQVSTSPGAAEADGGAEILRAAFLVTRDSAELFLAETRACAADGARCECTGPWPPYSFVALPDEEDR